VREESSGEVREPTDYIEVSWKLYENQSVDEIFKWAKRTLERLNLNPGLFRPIRFYDSTTPTLTSAPARRMSWSSPIERGKAPRSIRIKFILQVSSFIFFSRI
jgi:hypothetical protein